MSITLPRTSAVRLILLAVAGVLLLAFATPDPASAKPKTRTCNIEDEERELGPTYVTKLRVRSTSCSNGERVVKDWYKCRRANGGADGTCRKRVRGYKCKETRRNEIDTQFDATVSCRKGKYGYIMHRYTQFT